MGTSFQNLSEHKHRKMKGLEGLFNVFVPSRKINAERL
jgi:hypothetical protein